MKGIEKIYIKKKTVAIVIRSGINIPGINFLTDKSDPLQVGIHQHREGYVSKVRESSILKAPGKVKTHKYIYVERGRARVILSDKDHEIKLIKFLKQGDSIIIMNCVHRVHFSKNSKAIEIKQGPYEEK